MTDGWLLICDTPGWTPRNGAGYAILHDGSILIIGGYSGGWKKDVWRSTNGGFTWTQQTASAPWTARAYFGTVVLADGSVVIIGGATSASAVPRDVWRSTDAGVSWTRLTNAAGWRGRERFGCLLLDGNTIVIMGGKALNTYYSDVWKSIDGGITWTQVGSNATGGACFGFGCVLLPSGTIVTYGGSTGSTTSTNRVWHSLDNGATWSQVLANAPWTAREGLGAVCDDTGRIWMIGGANYTLGGSSEVWVSGDGGETWSIKENLPFTLAGMCTIITLLNKILVYGGRSAWVTMTATDDVLQYDLLPIPPQYVEPIWSLKIGPT